MTTTASSTNAPPLVFGERTLLMGVLNVTPDSFSDGGRYSDPRAACARARRMVVEGADVIDVGGESTRPGAPEIDAETEIQRVLPVIIGLGGRFPVPISIDTWKARTAAAALAAGARIVNDVFGFLRDPDMARVAAEHRALSVLMHHGGHDSPPVADIAETVRAGLSRSIDAALAAGLPESLIVLDPGIGFGKTDAQNLWLIREAGWLRRAFGLPVLIGASRKGFIGRILSVADARERVNGTLAVHVAAALDGADVIRAHDVAAHRDALRMVDALRAA